jgi:hypothetical protein
MAESCEGLWTPQEKGHGSPQTYYFQKISMQNTVNYSKGNIPPQLIIELLKIPEKTRGSFLAILANTWSRNNNHTSI